MKRSSNKKIINNSATRKVVSIVTIFVMLFSVFACDYQSGNGLAFAAQQYGVVVTPNGLNVRSGAGTNNTAIITLPFDTTVLIIGEAKDSSGNKWYKISKTYDGDEIVGYVMAKDSYIVLKDESSGSSSGTQDPGILESNCSYSEVLMEVGKQVGMNPYVIASMIIVEQGTNGVGASISGKNTGYECYYNYFNINAVAKDGYTAVENGLKYAKSDGTYYRPWNSRFKSILGGADLYAKNYILNNQNTLYFKKWNVMNGLSNVAVHQYMTNIEGAYEEAKNLKIGYQGLMDEALTFIIPIYENMPKDIALPPSASNNDELKEELARASETASLEGATGTEIGSSTTIQPSLIDQSAAIDQPATNVEYIPVDPYELMLLQQGFPTSYLPLISALHYAHPTWTFKPAITGLDWNDVLKKETVLGKSLVSKTKGEYWKSKKSPAYNSSTGTYKSYDTGGWNAASTVAVEYFLDPRRFISETGIFIFMSHEYDPLVQNINGLNKIVSGTFMQGAFPEYVEVFGPKEEDPSSQGSTSDQETTAKEEEAKNARIIDGVENTTIKNSSTRTSKGIKLSWTKSPGYKVDYYEVYRSTKKSSGYGKTPFYTTGDGNKTTYINTKDLKKGNTYYFKVRGVRIIDGKKYYTNYSTKSWRTIK